VLSEDTLFPLPANTMFCPKFPGTKFSEVRE
jgi:hypothetical protein